MYPNGMATELSGGDVLLAGGGTGQTHRRDEASAERYDVSSGKWRPAGRLSEARDAWLFTLPGDDVLATAGYRPGSA